MWYPLNKAYDSRLSFVVTKVNYKILYANRQVYADDKICEDYTINLDIDSHLIVFDSNIIDMYWPFV